MVFPRQEYWSGLSFPPPEYLPDPGIEPTSPGWQPISCVAGELITVWATREVLLLDSWRSMSLLGRKALRPLWCLLSCFAKKKKKRQHLGRKLKSYEFTFKCEVMQALRWKGFCSCRSETELWRPGFLQWHLVVVKETTAVLTQGGFLVFSSSRHLEWLSLWAERGKGQVSRGR